jgi:hypothetical protein
MLGDFADAVGKKGHLHFGVAGVRGVLAMLGHQLRRNFLGNRCHISCSVVFLEGEMITNSKVFPKLQGWSGAANPMRGKHKAAQAWNPGGKT